MTETNTNLSGVRSSAEAEKLRVRCPSCLKLYSVEIAKITTEEPEFVCVACESPFTFKYPPANPDRIIMAQLIKKTAEELIFVNNAQSQWPVTKQVALKDCPKCGAQNFADSKECYSCQVVFEKIKSVPLDPSLRATSRLAKMWQDLLNDFDNRELHMQFVRTCIKEGAVAYAHLQYQSFLEVQPHDETAKMMKAALLDGQLHRTKSQEVVPPKMREQMAQIDWKNWLPLVPYILAAILMMIGFSFVSLRNLVGFGAALAFLGVGLNVFFTGSIFGHFKIKS